MQNSIPPIPANDPLRRVQSSKDAKKKRPETGTRFSLEDADTEASTESPTTEHGPVAPSTRTEPGGQLDVTG